MSGDQAADPRQAAGETMFDEVYGGVVPLPPESMRDGYVTDMLNHLFGEVWTRSALSIGQRRLMILGVAAALGEESIIEFQLRAALAKGELTREQLPEILIFLVNYVGYPRAGGLQRAIARVLADTPA